jgi:acyl-CoA dehydrogenase
MVLRAACESTKAGTRDWISMVKIEAAETLGRVADRAVQIFGGMVLQRNADRAAYRDAHIGSDSTSEIHRTIVARSAPARRSDEDIGI